MPVWRSDPATSRLRWRRAAGPEAVGELLPLDDDTAWITALDALVRDPDRRAALAERARTRAQLFTAERMADGFEHLRVPTAPEGRLYRPQPG